MSMKPRLRNKDGEIDKLNKLIAEKEQTINQRELDLERVKFKNLQSEYELNQKLNKHEAKENHFKAINNQVNKNIRLDASGYEELINDMKLRENMLMEEISNLKAIIKKLKNRNWVKIRTDKSIISPDQSINNDSK